MRQIKANSTQTLQLPALIDASASRPVLVLSGTISEIEDLSRRLATHPVCTLLAVRSFFDFSKAISPSSLE